MSKLVWLKNFLTIVKSTDYLQSLLIYQEGFGAPITKSFWFTLSLRMPWPWLCLLALLCPIMPSVPNSSGWKCVSGRQLVSNRYPYRTQCRNKCNAGFLTRPGTTSFMMCGLDPARLQGKWSGTSLVCEREYYGFNIWICIKYMMYIIYIYYILYL